MKTIEDDDFVADIMDRTERQTKQLERAHSILCAINTRLVPKDAPYLDLLQAVEQMLSKILLELDSISDNILEELTGFSSVPSPEQLEKMGFNLEEMFAFQAQEQENEK